MTTTKKPILSARARVASLSLALATALGVGIWLMPASADVSQTAATAERSSDEERDQFRSDLEKARELEGEDRRDAVRGLRDDARDGKYGDGIEQRLERRGAHRAAFAALLPDEMQADLTEAKEIDDPEDRKARHEDIREKALDGGYGKKVEEAFTILGKSRRGGPPPTG